jgi:pyruvate dehydrogenase (quinone)/pyruvate oxidase
MEPIADYTALVADGKGFSVQLNLAYGTAWNRGAVAHLSIPKNVWTQKADGVIYPSPPVLPKVFSPPDQLEEAAKQLEQAKRPVLLVGRGIGRDGAKAVALAERLQAPIIVTMPAKPLLPNHHPLFVGGLGQAGSQAATDLLKAADLFVILGATWWPEEYVPERISIIQVDARPENIGRTHPCLVALVGGLSYVLDQWLNRLRQRENSAWVHEIKKHRQNWVKRVEQEISQQTIPLAPARVMVVLGTMVKPDAIVAVDVGDHTLWFERAFPFRGQDLLLSGRWRTLGFALPAAIAAQLAKPDRQVIAFAGDGGFSTTLVEMATAATLGLPLKVFVLNNGAYAMEKNRMSVAGMYPLGASLLNPDFVRLAEAFGFKGMRVKREEELAIMKEALSADQPALVEIQCAQTMVPHTKI